MATSIGSTSDAPGNDSREQYLAFVTDGASQDIVDRVFSEMMLPSAAIRKGDVQGAVKYLSEHRSPKLLLVDLTGAELPLSEINALADVCEPGVTVLTMGDRNDCGLFRDLLAHGVADYLVKPLTPQLLQKALVNATEHSGVAKAPSKLGKLIAVVGARGGVGSTMVASSVAWLIANERRRRVALVDLDLQFGTVALSLDLEPANGFREALENPNRIDGLMLDRILVQHSDRMFVLSAEEAPDEALLIDYGAVDLLITELRSRFHFVIVDLPRGSGAATHQVLQGATDMLLVSDLSLAGMRDAMRLSSLLPTMNASCSISVIVNRTGEHKQGEMPRAEFEKGIGRKIDFTLPFDARTVAAATNFGQPVAGTKGPVAQGLHAVADKLCGQQAGSGRRGRAWLKLLKS